VSCDVSEEWTAVARRYFAEAGLEERIELRIGPALETLAALPASEPFDFAFIDADKVNYPNYWERVVELLRPGGLAVVDNTFYDGRVIADDVDDGWQASTEGVRRTNRMIADDERVDEAMLGVADGITLALKR
jgi:predicted O-methyltransferase YrrM